MRMKRFSALALAVLIAVPVAVAEDKKKDPDEIGDRDVGKGVNFYSIEKEIALGKQLAQEVERQAKMVTDPVISEYVNRIGQNLVRNSDAKVPFTIKVIDAEEINAFALPGGFFFVNTGVLINADSEAEMAGVMAHEIAHVAARHGTRQATRGQLARFATIPLIFVGGWTGYAIYQGASLAIPMGDRARGSPPRHAAGHTRTAREVRHHSADLRGRLDGLRYLSRREPGDPDGRSRTWQPATARGRPHADSSRGSPPFR